MSLGVFFEIVKEAISVPFLILVSLLSRWRRKRFDVGLGPDPNPGNISLKQALESRGYRAETFVYGVSHITQDFDIRGDYYPNFPRLRLFLKILSRYRALYLFFHGGPLSRCTHVLWRLEPYLYRLAGIKVVMLCYGSDVQDLTRSPNLLFKDAMSRDYPSHRLRRPVIAAKIDLWTRVADHVIGGCEWVDYLYHWDSLMLAHFTVDLESWKPGPTRTPSENLLVVHAPNHRTIKGTGYLEEAVKKLQAEGLPVELQILERVSREEVKTALARADLVVDQLVIGWYGLFALEAMALGIPVVVYLREDLKEFYRHTRLLDSSEPPVLEAGPATIEELLRQVLADRSLLEEKAARSRDYVARHHSIEFIGGQLAGINEAMGL